MSPVKTRLPPRAAVLDRLERYERGMSIAEARRAGARDVVKLASNENPLGPSPRALEAIAAAAREAHRYPDSGARDLRERLAGAVSLSASQIAIGNGSVELIDLLAGAFLSPGDTAVVGEKGFARFRQLVRARNGEARLVPMRDLTHDLDAMAAAIDQTTRLVFVANPNNPTGTWNRRAEVDALVRALPAGVLLVLDEAYSEFASHAARGDYPDGTTYVRQGAPVVALRTFSKAYGLAGVRVGYAMASDEVIEAVEAVREPFNSSHLAQAAAMAALDDREHVVRTLELIEHERPRMAAELSARGLGITESIANFLLVDARRDAAPLFRALLARGVIVRPLRAYGLDTSLRITVGTAAENGRLLEALDRALAEERPA
ncbi:MAG TPA: histidinol-phosphate transaminase [Vicinamibacteria bacterium]